MAEREGGGRGIVPRGGAAAGRGHRAGATRLLPHSTQLRWREAKAIEIQREKLSSPCDADDDDEADGGAQAPRHHHHEDLAIRRSTWRSTDLRAEGSVHPVP